MAASISRTLTRKLLNPPHKPLLSLPTVNPVSPLPFSSLSSAVEPTTQPLPPHSKGSERSQWSRWILFLPGAITFGLGTWQIVRREEKIKVLDYRQKRLGLEPLRWNNASLSSKDLGGLEFRRIVCQGEFDEKKSVYVGPRSRSISGVTENGYYLITPLVPIPNVTKSVQAPILVNRGWVPRSWRDKSIDVSRIQDQTVDVVSVSGPNDESSWWRFWSKKPEKIMENQASAVTPVEVVGVVRGSENPSIFVPANDPNSFQWFYVDVPQIARASGLPENSLYIEHIDENINPSDPYPVPKDAMTLIRSSVMPQDHLNYTMTWYSLSAAVTFMAFKRLRPTQSRR